MGSWRLDELEGLRASISCHMRTISLTIPGLSALLLAFCLGYGAWGQTPPTDQEHVSPGLGFRAAQELSAARSADPRKIAFYVDFTNFFVTSTTAHGTFKVSEGTPCYMAILINTNNYGTALWQPYTPQIDLTLGPADGSHIQD